MGDAPSYNEADLERIADSNVDADNPFTSARPTTLKKKEVEPSQPTFQERMKRAQLQRYANVENRIIPQRVVAIHSQKGGVGKSTITRELAISTACSQINTDMLARAVEMLDHYEVVE